MSFVDREAPPVQVIREHPPLMADLVRRTGVCLPGQVEVDLDAEGSAVLRGDADMLPLTARLAEQAGSWTVTVTRDAEVLAVKRLGDGGLDLDDGGPWLVIFREAIGAIDMKKEGNRGGVLYAIDEVAPDARTIQRLVTRVMRATPKRVRIRLESSMGTMWPPVRDFYQHAVDEGYELALRCSQIESVLMVRGITMTDEQRADLNACEDLHELDTRSERARLAAPADVFGG